MKTSLVIKKCSSYNAAAINKEIKESIDLLGGIDKFAKKGQKVLLKPNMLANVEPQKAVTTHPEIIRAVAEIFLEQGCIVSIGDSPAVHNFYKSAVGTGISKVAEDLKIPLASFDETEYIDVPGSPDYKRIEIAKAVRDADVIINLPKVKTHVYMYLTLSIKNCFGIISGIRKAKWHIEAGKSAEQFSKALLACLAAMKPALTIVDGIIGMEGDGPQSGSPRELGFVMTGTDCVAIDRVICEMLRCDISKFHVLSLAEKLNIGVTDLKKIEILGNALSDFDIHNFKTPSRSQFAAKILYTHFRDFLTDTPIIDSAICKKCGDCMRICPAEALSSDKSRGGKIMLDTKKCIRCFCCHEICPHLAIHIKKPLLLKIVESGMKIKGKFGL